MDIVHELESLEEFLRNGSTTPGEPGCKDGQRLVANPHSKGYFPFAHLLLTQIKSL